ncbi:hypothetical protein [Lysinibacillus sp. BW-2-10]|uniref:hypothetical protein n=1 Tax=Lysinibacillus sp. BW-2-10 TaxID=2590030 RepID=UPI00117CD240|nr:hypothetical protein [Lysinibacillus sp. BW-2-10]TSI07908.1 hypothetical protein FJQ64_08010 [Lysinibacillus sp. BW-2-10]
MSVIYRFFENNPTCNGFKDNVSFNELFSWLEEATQVFNMIQACNNNQAALEGVVKELEEKYSNRSDLDLTDHFTRRTIGRVVKEILIDFGYIQTGEKSLSQGEYFNRFPKEVSHPQGM